MLNFTPPWIVDFVVNTTIGAVVSLVVGVQAARIYAEITKPEPPIRFDFITDSAGMVKPFPLIAISLKQTGNLSLIFDPSELQATKVCEFARISGVSYEDIFFQYVTRYSTCFSITESKPSIWLVRPNKNSKNIVLENGQWYCNCAK